MLGGIASSAEFLQVLRSIKRVSLGKGLRRLSNLHLLKHQILANFKHLLFSSRQLVKESLNFTA